MLKQMILARKIEQARGQMTELISKRDGEIAEKRKALQLREEELEKALEEVTEETQEFWAMNSTTKTKLVAEAMAFNSAAAIASGVNSEMPVIGGAIVELDFIPDNVIIAGWGDLYCLAQRAGTALAVSTE